MEKIFKTKMKIGMFDVCIAHIDQTPNPSRLAIYMDFKTDKEKEKFIDYCMNNNE